MSDTYIILFVNNVVDTLMKMVYLFYFHIMVFVTARLNLSLAIRKVTGVVYYRTAVILSYPVDCHKLGKMLNSPNTSIMRFSGMFSIQWFETLNGLADDSLACYITLGSARPSQTSSDCQYVAEF